MWPENADESEGRRGRRLQQRLRSNSPGPAHQRRENAKKSTVEALMIPTLRASALLPCTRSLLHRHSSPAPTDCPSRVRGPSLSLNRGQSCMRVQHVQRSLATSAAASEEGQTVLFMDYGLFSDHVNNKEEAVVIDDTNTLKSHHAK